MRRAVDLADVERIDVEADRRLNIAYCKIERSVDADRDIDAAFAQVP